MTAPLTPAFCNLSDFEFMPLDVRRLRDSGLATTATPEECWAAVLLWAASWHQTPAASLPDDDRQLASFAGYGRVVKEWLKVRPGALHGFIRCSDGRLYHPVVAEKALEAWRGKMERLWRTECARIKKHNQRTGEDVVPPDFPAFDRGYVAMSLGTPGHVPEDNGPCPDAVPRETASKGTGKGTGTGTGTDSQESLPSVVPLSKRARRCPGYWHPDEAVYAVGAELGLSRDEVDAELEAMRDYEFATQHTDWDATGRNWLRKAAKQRGRRNGATGPPLTYAMADGLVREAGFRMALDELERRNGNGSDGGDHERDQGARLALPAEAPDPRRGSALAPGLRR